MSSSIFSLKTLISCTNLKCASSRRRYCHASTSSLPQQQMFSHLQRLGQSQIPNVVVLESHFTPPTTKWEIDHSPRLGTAFFLDPTLIATSIHTVARLAPNRDDSAQIARTLAFNHKGAVMTTRPLAVNFATGVAVLEVLQHSAASAPPPPGCALAETPPGKDDVILAVTRHQSVGLAMMIGNVRGGAAAERGVPAKAPWPLDDGAGWIEHGWFGIGIGDPAPGSGAALGLGEASVTRLMGSPWFNVEGEVVGVAAWEVKDDEFSVGFAAPAASVRAVADYVKTKGGRDPLVMDTWIDTHVFFGDE